MPESSTSASLSSDDIIYNVFTLNPELDDPRFPEFKDEWTNLTSAVVNLKDDASSNYGFAVPGAQYQLKSFQAVSLGLGNSVDAENYLNPNNQIPVSNAGTSGTVASETAASGNSDQANSGSEAERLSKAYNTARSQYLEDAKKFDPDLQGADLNSLETLDFGTDEKDTSVTKDAYLRYKFGADLYSLKQILIAAEET